MNLSYFEYLVFQYTYCILQIDIDIILVITVNYANLTYIIIESHRLE
jgi:hypothetical protein